MWDLFKLNFLAKSTTGKFSNTNYINYFGNKKLSQFKNSLAFKVSNLCFIFQIFKIPFVQIIVNTYKKLKQMLQQKCMNTDRPKKYFCFRSRDSEKAIGVTNCDQDESNLVIENDFVEQSHCFAIVPSHQDYYIKSMKTCQYLTVENTDNGSRIYCSEMSNQPNQKFRIEQTFSGSDQYIIYTFCGKVLDVAPDKNDKGRKKVIQNQANGSSTQKWTLADFKDVGLKVGE